MAVLRTLPEIAPFKNQIPHGFATPFTDKEHSYTWPPGFRRSSVRSGSDDFGRVFGNSETDPESLKILSSRAGGVIGSTAEYRVGAGSNPGRSTSRTPNAGKKRTTFAGLRFHGLGCGKFPISVWLVAQGTSMQFTSFLGRCTTSRIRHGEYLFQGEFLGFHHRIVQRFGSWKDAQYCSFSTHRRG